MAHKHPDHQTRVNYFSNPNVHFPGTGTVTGVEGKSNNAAVLIKNRFNIAAIGDESVDCGPEKGKLNLFFHEYPGIASQPFSKCENLVVNKKYMQQIKYFGISCLPLPPRQENIFHPFNS